jgi:tetratricopeptide (TPR) repeat protein
MEESDELSDCLADAEAAMFDERFEDAAPLYQRALALNPKDHNADPFWLRMSLAESWFRREAWPKAMDAYGRALAKNREAAVGNPLFHLRVGQCLFELASPDARLQTGPSTAMDNLARALICGGIEMFDDEPPQYLDAIAQILRPPADAPSWQATRGRGAASRDKLDGAVEHEFLWAMLESRGVVQNVDVLDPKYWKPKP